MGEREKVDGDPARPAGDSLDLVHALRHRREYGVAGRIPRMDDPPFPVPALDRQIELAGSIAIERDAQLVDQHLLHDARSLPHKLLDRRGI